MHHHRSFSGSSRWMAALAFLFVLTSFSAVGQVVPIRKLDALKTVPTPTPPDLSNYVRDKVSLVRLGKALFWDMNVGSDGKTACATCHFNAGADSRAINTVSPGLKAGDQTYQVGGGPNYHLQATDFPFSRAVNDVVSSAGVHGAQFGWITPGNNVDGFTPMNPDPDSYNVLNNLGFNSITRKVEPRNTPSAVNAVFNYRNFWDGRAQNECNFLNPFGARDQDPAHHLYVTNNTTVNGRLVQSVTTIKPLTTNASLCSQALGPPLSNFEMSAGGRSFWDLGKKMLSLPALSQQSVALTDSVLGKISAYPVNGLKSTYLGLINSAFQAKWFKSPFNICVSPGANPGDPPIETTINTSKAGAACPAGATRYTMAEYNFSLFWSLAVQAYEATLRTDQSKLDKFLTASDATATTLNLGTGDGSAVTFSGVIPAPVLFGAVTVQAGPFVGNDDGQGNIVSENGDVTGTVDYQTGAIALTFTSPPALGDLVNVSSQKIPGGFLTAQEVQGLSIFQGKGLCSRCHGGPEMTNASVANVGNQPLERMFFQPSGLIKVYDTGFYNTGVRQTLEDIALAAFDPFGNPLSRSELERQEVCNDPTLVINVPPRPNEGIPAAPLSCNDLINRDGTFKTPTIRNVELTAPYFHNGGQRTLKEVVQFYNRGGDFPVENQDNLDPDIVPLGLTPAEEDALVAFMLATTDPRAKYQKAPFDHPSIILPHGHPTAWDTIQNAWVVTDDGTGQAQDGMFTLPAVGAAGSAQPQCTFAETVDGFNSNGACP